MQIYTLFFWFRDFFYSRDSNFLRFFFRGILFVASFFRDFFFRLFSSLPAQRRSQLQKESGDIVVTGLLPLNKAVLPRYLM